MTSIHSRRCRLIKQYFGEIRPSQTPAYNPPQLQPQTAERVETMVDPLAELPAFHIAYHIPPDREPDHYPLDLLSIVLGDGESSRLYQKLVKGKELLQEIDVSTDARRGPDLLSVWAICLRRPRRSRGARDHLPRAYGYRQQRHHRARAAKGQEPRAFHVRVRARVEHEPRDAHR